MTSTKNNKKKKKFPVWMVVVGVIMIVFVIVFIKINTYLKNKKNNKIETAIQEPDIDAEESKKGYDVSKNNDLIGIFNRKVNIDTLKKDSVEIKDTIPEIKKPVKTSNPQIKKKAEPKKTENALLSTIKEEEKKKNATKKVYRKPVVKKNTEYRDVEFNFIVVKNEKEIKPTNNETLSKSKNEKKDLFFGLTQAKVYGSQILKHGEPVTLRATEKVEISKNTFVPIGALLYGECRVSTGRLSIKITRAKTPKGNFMVDLDVYDSDFQQGIFMSSRHIDIETEENGEDVMDEIGEAIPNQLVGGLVKATSRSAQKDLKKMKRASINVPDGYVVYVRSNPIER